MSKKMLQAAAGNAGGGALYVEDVFSTYLYDGNGTTQTITNGIDLDGEGGLVWCKPRTVGNPHYLGDTERGTTKFLESNSTAAEGTSAGDVTAFNADGFSVGSTGRVNQAGQSFASWTFRKAEKFFDVVTYTGNGSTQTINHNLGSAPGCIIVKPTSASDSNWFVYHRSLGVDAFLILNLTNAAFGYNGGFSNITSTSFGVADSNNVNGLTYVAYLFAHTPTSNFVQESFSASYFADGVSPVSVNGPDGSGEYVMYTNTSIGNTYAKIAGVSYSVSGTDNWGGISDVIFAATGSRYKQGAYEYTNGGIAPHYQVDYYSQYSGPVYEDEESFIVCGSYTEPASGTWLDINLGFETQWVMVKSATSASQWTMFDVMRDATGQYVLQASSSNAEADFGSSYLTPTATGFKAKGGLLGSGQTIIYIAIRRPMKTPESGTEVFAMDTQDSTDPAFDSPFPPDMALRWFTSGGSYYPQLASRLTGNKYQVTHVGTSEYSDTFWNLWGQEGVGTSGSDNSNVFCSMFKRATGFFDVVVYTGDGTSNRSINHNLAVTPELIIGRIRAGQTDYGGVWQASLGDQGMYLAASNSAGATLVAEGHTSSIFKVSNSYGINNVSTLSHIAYLFGSVDGVSKVGSYTGTGSNVNVDCGFSTGARFILIKRTDSSGGWHVWDSARGIVAGNDPYFLLNSTAAEVTSTDYIDPLSSGFTVTSSAPVALNASGGSYIFLAIA